MIHQYKRDIIIYHAILWVFVLWIKTLWFINVVIQIRHICFISFILPLAVVIMTHCLGECMFLLYYQIFLVGKIPDGSWECPMNYVKLAVISSRPVWVNVVTIVTNSPLKWWRADPPRPQHSINAIKLEGEFVLMQALLITEISHEKMSVSRTLLNIRSSYRRIRFN